MKIEEPIDPNSAVFPDEPSPIRVYINYEWVIYRLENKCGNIPENIKQALRQIFETN